MSTDKLQKNLPQVVPQDVVYAETLPIDAEIDLEVEEITWEYYNFYNDLDIHELSIMLILYANKILKAFLYLMYIKKLGLKILDIWNRISIK